MWFSLLLKCLSRQLDDTYCEIVFFILISLGLFSRLHFESKAGVRPETRRARGDDVLQRGHGSDLKPEREKIIRLLSIFGLIRPTLIDFRMIFASMRLSFLIYQAIIQ